MRTEYQCDWCKCGLDEWWLDSGRSVRGLYCHTHAAVMMVGNPGLRGKGGRISRGEYPELRSEP